MTEQELPTAVRRNVCFASALLLGSIIVEGIQAHGCATGLELALVDLDPQDGILVVADPTAVSVRQLWAPDVIIDGRIRKRNLDNHLSDARLVIGLGPGLEAGKDVHVVIDTNRGHDLGRIVWEGFAAPNTGVPGEIAGHSWSRVLRAPQEGIWLTDLDIGQPLAEGCEVGRVLAGSKNDSSRSLFAQCGGVIRGLLRTNTAVTKGQKIGDIDPRGDRRYCFTISDKARTISGSVLEVLLAKGFSPKMPRSLVACDHGCL